MGLSKEDREGLDKSLKDLKLSHDELDKFSKAFKDPEFLKLFEDYAKEVSDPKVKAETDLYLRQLEMEGRVEEVYGKGAQLILPTPSFVVKTQNTADGQKVFINVCTSDKLGEASLKSAVDASGRKGQSLDLPLCLGPKKTGTDKAGGPCSVWDFVVHPKALDMAAATPAIKKSIIEMALEKIEDANQGVTLHRGCKEPKMTYKAAEGCPKPHALAMRGPGSESVKGRVKPTPTAVSSGLGAATAATAAAAAAAATSGTTTAASTAAASETAVASAGEAAEAAGGRSKFSFPTKQAPQATPKAAPTDPTSPGYVHASGEVTPMFEVVHRGQIDLSEAWGDAGRGIAINTTHPKELVIRIQLPGVASAAAAELEVSRMEVSVLVPGKYRLVAPLPYPVNSDLGRAKFDKSKQQLEVMVPVVPPPLPPTPLAPSPIQEVPSGSGDADVEDGVEARRSMEGQGGSAVEEVAEASGAQAVTAKQEAEGKVQEVQEAEEKVQEVQGEVRDEGTKEERGRAPGQAAEEQAEGESGLTENQRRWLELHRTQVEASAAAAAAAVATAAAAECVGAGSSPASVAESVDAGVEGFTPAPAFQGARKGYVFRMGPQGLGYYKDVPPVGAVRSAHTSTPVTLQAKPVAAPPAPKLQPRLTSALVADLD